MNKLSLTSAFLLTLLSSTLASSFGLISYTQMAVAKSDLAWQSLQGVLNSSPVVSRNADGRLQVFAVAPNHILYYISQDSPNGRFIGNWQPISGIAVNGDPIIASNADGKLVIFARGMDNHLYHLATIQSMQTTKTETLSQQRQQPIVTSNNNNNNNNDNNVELESSGIPWITH